MTQRKREDLKREANPLRNLEKLGIKIEIVTKVIPKMKIQSLNSTGMKRV